MYLVSIYFDDKTNRIIQQYIDKVAQETGNIYMKEMEVPQHMTSTAFETLSEAQAVEALARAAKRLNQGKVLWASVGQFFPYVLFISPVLNQYLHEISEIVHEEFAKIEDLKFHPQYLPFSWQPHTTVGKKLSQEEMRLAFEVMQKQFAVFQGTTMRIGLAKPNPHRDLALYSVHHDSADGGNCDE
jgi:hypothetical protein